MKIKIIILFYFGLIISLNVKAQKVNLNDRISIDLPASKQKVSRAEIVNIAKQQKINLSEPTEKKETQFFVIDNVILQVSAFSRNEKVDLEKMKLQLSTGTEGSTAATYKIVKRNENQFLIVEFPTLQKMYFYATNNVDNTQVTGALSFTKANQSKAHSVLNTIISNMRVQK